MNPVIKCRLFQWISPMLWLLWTALMLSTGVSAAAESESESTSPRLNRISDTLYQFTDGNAAGAVMLTDAGAVVVDPANTELAIWLQDELEQRFDQNVRYVIYSSHLPDRIGGAEIFAADGAQIIAHENTLPHLREAGSGTLPNLVFSSKLSLLLGSASLDLHYFGQSLTDNAIVVHFPAEEAVYAGAMVAIEALPDFNAEVVAGAYIPEWFNTINRMNRIDFIYLLTAQDKIGIQNDGVQHGHFLRELNHRISQAHASGASLTDMQTTVTMNNYRRWQNHDNLPALIQGMLGLIVQD